MVYDVIIIGAGIAGMTAAVYARRAGRTVLIIEKESIGGQITLSHRVENYPGHSAISGLDLADKLLQQAMELGAELEVDEVTPVEKKDGLFEIACGYGSFTAKAVVCATGLKHRRLEAAEGFTGSGVVAAGEDGEAATAAALVVGAHIVIADHIIGHCDRRSRSIFKQ